MIPQNILEGRFLEPEKSPYDQSLSTRFLFGRQITHQIAKSYLVIILISLFKYILDKSYDIYKNPNTSWQADFSCWGNVSTLSDADVICLGEKHSDLMGCEKIDRLINQYFFRRTILLEGQESGILKKAKLTNRPLLSGGLDILGWEPPNFNKLYGEAFDEFYKKKRQLHQLIEETQELLKDCLKDGDELLRSDVEEFKRELDKLREWLQIPISIRYVFSKEKKNKTNIDEFSKFLSCVEANLLKVRPTEQYYKNVSKKDVKLRETIPVRNQSLIREIALYRAKGKKIIVIGGYAHFFRVNSDHPDYTKEIKTALAKYKFAILVPYKLENPLVGDLRCYNHDLRVLNS